MGEYGKRGWTFGIRGPFCGKYGGGRLNAKGNGGKYLKTARGKGGTFLIRGIKGGERPREKNIPPGGGETIRGGFKKRRRLWGGSITHHEGG